MKIETTAFDFQGYVVYPGTRRYTIMPADGTATGVPVQAIPLIDLAHIRADWS